MAEVLWPPSPAWRRAMTHLESAPFGRNEKVSYFAKNRFRVRRSLGALLAVFLLLAPISRAEEVSLGQRCRQFFSGFMGGAKKAEAQKPDAPRRSSRILFSGGRGPLENTLRAELDEIHVLLEKFSRPPSTTVYFEETDRLGHFAYDDLNIHLPNWMATKISRTDQRLRKSVIQHEYGHAIFIANFGEYSSEWKAWYDSANRINVNTRRFFETPKPYELIHLSSPYQELFADLLTVVAQNDPQAMAEPLASAIIFSRAKDGGASVKKVSKESANIRNFTAAGSDPDWNQPEIDVHHLFSPARRHLWENYFSRERPFREQGLMMRKVFEVLATDIMARYDTPALRNLAPRELNARLIRALDEALAEYKLK